MNRADYEAYLLNEYYERTGGRPDQERELTEFEVWLIEELYYHQKMLDNLNNSTII